MKQILAYLSFILIWSFSACKSYQTELTYENPDQRIVFLHHSTGYNVWKGQDHSEGRLAFRTSSFDIPGLLQSYNEEHHTKYAISELSFPTGNGYPWANYPYDYYNIWVKNAETDLYPNEPRLKDLTEKYDLIIFKHCFPGSNILANEDSADINSPKKTLANYKLQYEALKQKMHKFPETRFLVWTLAAQVESQISEAEALRAIEFVSWVKNEWDEEGDNIYIFDFNAISREGGLYLKPEYASGEFDSHPNEKLSGLAAEKLVNRIVELPDHNQ